MRLRSCRLRNHGPTRTPRVSVGAHGLKTAAASLPQSKTVLPTIGYGRTLDAMARTRTAKTQTPQSTAQQLASLIKSCRDIMRRQRRATTSFYKTILGYRIERLKVPDDFGVEWSPEGG